ncbi:DUF1858 domain-containing protein [Azospirillum sp. sgz301742]
MRKDRVVRRIYRPPMTEPPFPIADVLIADVLERWPQTLAVFLKHRMACPGCAMAPFMTLGEAGQCYGLPAADLVDEVRRAIDGDTPTTL